MTANALTLTEAHESALSGPFLRFLDIDGAAVSTIGAVLGSETISASDALAARLDEIQFDLGEGPCWDALSTANPVLEPDWIHHERSWPGFEAALGVSSVGALFAFPLMIGPLRLGAIDLYTVRPKMLSDEQVSQTQLLAKIVSRMVLRRALRLSEDEWVDPPDTKYSRRVVHQATGVVLAQLRIAPDDALLLIKGHAFSAGRSVIDISTSIVDGRLKITNDLIETKDSD
ncbi:GAF and ANTAR domain-containing protein [Subtercola vilae]|uniref:GAF and ANTAR domain-containing protein n=1 Tax=Subtercola vilae TaxID=2056433 RepID=UPI001F3FDFBA|nr:GAF and ANTAR domain-containing protein [Subtercola vilae]